MAQKSAVRFIKRERRIFKKAVPKAILSHKKKLFDLACEFRAKPAPPVPGRFITYVHPAFMNASLLRFSVKVEISQKA